MLCYRVSGRPQSSCDLTSSAGEPRYGHVTVPNDVIIGDDAVSLLLGSIDDVTSLDGPVSKNIKVFVCSTGAGYYRIKDVIAVIFFAI